MVQININKLNGRINLLSVCLGFIISIIVLLIGALFFGGYVTSGITNVSLYIGTVLLCMAFFGSIVAGFFGDKNYSDGSINGAFLCLIILILTSFVLGILIFVFIGMAALISSALSSAFHTAPSTVPATIPTTTTSSSSNTNYDTIINLIEFIIFIVLYFVSGILGGAFGVFLKLGIKKIIGRKNK